jgi:hypothetical protein
LIVAAIVIISTVMSVVALSLEATPFAGPLIAAIVVQLTVTYVTVVIVGEYLSTSGRQGPSVKIGAAKPPVKIGAARPPDAPPGPDSRAQG